jgi:hypothetical protein
MPQHPRIISEARAANLYRVEVTDLVPPLPPAPVVTPATFNATLPLLNNQLLGTLVATGAPTTWTITGGNAAGFFAIDNTGNVSVTAAGVAGITATTYNLTVTATNTGGTSSGAAVTINIT